MRCDQFVESLDVYLNAKDFKDYAPNGLQVQGKEEIRKIVLAVTATQSVIERAAELNADALLVHHGWFWKGEDPRIIRTKYRRLKALMDSNINLISYHLPLDAHVEVGNNAQLGQLLEAKNCRQMSEMDLLWMGEIEPCSIEILVEGLSKKLHRDILVLGSAPTAKITSLAWCSGAAEDFFENAIVNGAQAYISGEATERTTHLARESGVPYLVCGHHATERLGIQALGRWIEKTLEIPCLFVDDDNPL